MRLSDYDTDRAAFHLGMNPGANVPAGDLAAFYESCRRIASSFWYEKVIEHINRCDRAWEESEVLRNAAEDGSIAPTRQQRVFGDANRVISISDALQADTQYREIYLRECDRLAETLYVPNYRRGSAQRYDYAMDGSTVIEAVPGPADVAVGTRLQLADTWA